MHSTQPHRLYPNKGLHPRVVGEKLYELTDHLGNVRTTITDRKLATFDSNWLITGYTADIKSANDYFSFGSEMPGRSYNSGDYRYGFNGHEKDDEIKGNGNHLSFGDYGYDPRIGRRWNIDPAFNDLPGLSPYVFSFNSPIVFNDQNGKKAKVTINRNENGGGTITLSTTIYVSGLQEDNKDIFISTMIQETKAILKNGTYIDNKGNSWQIVYDINFKSGEIGGSAEDKHFNNQLTVNATENKADIFSGQGNITETTVKGVVKGNRDKIGTALEESIHFLGFADQYDIVTQGWDQKEIGVIAKEGFENDVLTGSARPKDYQFSNEHNNALGSFLEAQGILLKDNTTETSKINTRINGGRKEVQREKLSPERQKQVVRNF